MLCSERIRLLTAYRDATNQYARSVHDLFEGVTLEQGDASLLRIRCAQFWEHAEQARVSLGLHEAKHFCQYADYAEWVALKRPGP